MDEIIKKISAALCTAFTFAFGGTDGLFLTLAALIILDYISGVIAAFAEKKLSSAVGAKGIAKKLFMLFIVAVANIIDVNIIGEGNVLRSITAVFYIANECISLIENAGRLGVPVPKKLLDVLEQLKEDK